MGESCRRCDHRIASAAAVVAALAALAALPAAASAAEVECYGPSGAAKACDAQSPTASFQWSPESPERREWVTFTATARAASGRAVESVRWDFFDQEFFEDAEGEVVEHPMLWSGPHRISLRVEDDRGEVAIARETVQVTDPDVPLEPVDEAVSVRQNPFHDGFLDASEPAPPLGLVWERRLEGHSPYALVADGKVFAAVRAPARDAGRPDRWSRVYAFDAATGEIAWSRLLGDRYGETRPAYEDGRLFLVNSDGLVLALDSSNGRTLWGANVFMDAVSTPPVAYDGHLYVLGSGIGGVLYALDTATGEQLWRSEVSYNALPSPTIAPNDVVLSSQCPDTLALDRFWGFGQWWQGTGCTGGGGSFPSAYRNGLIHAAEGGAPGKVYRLDGSFVRDFTADHAPAVADDLALYVEDGEMRAERPESGAPLWTFTGDGNLASAPLIVGDTAYVASEGGRLYGVDTSSGLETWRTDLDPGIARGELAAGGGRLVLSSGDRLRVFGHDPAAPPPDDELPGAHALVAGLPPAGSAPGEAVTFQLDAGHTGFLNVADPAPPLRERWTQTYVEGPLPDPWRHPLSYPLIAGGRVFVVARNSGGGAGEPAAVIHAMDAASGEPLWDLELPGGINERWVSHAYGDGRLYVLTHDGTLLALDAATGDEQWRRQVSGGETFGAPPVVAEGVVYVAANGSMTAVLAANGDVLWTQGVVGGLGSAPAVDAETVYGSWVCRSTSALGRDTGEILWSNGGLCSGGSGWTPVLAGGRLYTRETDIGRTLDAGDGAILDGFAGDGPPVLAGELMVNVANGELFAQEASTGRLLWRFEGDGWLTSAPLVVGRYAYVASAPPWTDGRLFAVDLADGGLAWESPLPGDVRRPEGDDGELLPPTGLAAGGGLIVVPADGRLVAFESAGAPAAAPDTRIDVDPGNSSGSDGVRFEFGSPAEGARFQCSVDGGAWTACQSPLTLSGLASGTRRFEVRAVSPGGVADPTPAVHEWRVEQAAGEGGGAPGDGTGAQGGGQSQGSAAGSGAAGGSPAGADTGGAPEAPRGAALRLARRLRATGSTGLVGRGRVRLPVEGPDGARLSAVVVEAVSGARAGRSGVLARGAVGLRPGRDVLELRLTRHGRRALRRPGRHALRLRLTLSAAGGTATAERRLSLRGAGPSRPR